MVHADHVVGYMSGLAWASAGIKNVLHVHVCLSGKVSALGVLE